MKPEVLLYRLARPLFFSLDAERAHELVLGWLALAAELAFRTGTVASPPSGPEVEQELWGLRFPNPVGLAAGFDKNARVVPVLPLLGFGFAEVGTVTALPQEGNPKPRIARLVEQRALVNRLGFNNEGAPAVAARMERWRRAKLPLPVGGNVGKSAATPLEQAQEDYLFTLETLLPFVDFLVVNVSSPNTPGLRELQRESELRRLVGGLVERNRELAREKKLRKRPLLLKIAPDLPGDAVRKAVDVALETGVDGIVATNTLAVENSGGLPFSGGGLSGAPLRERSNEVIRRIFRHSEGKLPIVGVGGVFSGEDAWEKVLAGASLVEVYTGLVYEGALLPRLLARELAARVRKAGGRRLADFVGSGA
ncbi:MAG: dihydroorotate dehydrogenase (quinone) [Candidatus Binatia bacterium]|nr:MAG: dihydroorotate dehydrogenase (quinone) [Candidatus Binatia bacterium]